MVPFAEEAGIAWQETSRYDDWDAVASGLFEGFVLNGIWSSNEWGDECSDFVGYDLAVGSYGEFSYIETESPSAIGPLVSFETRAEPFDTARVAVLNEHDLVTSTVEVPVSSCRFRAVARFGCGHRRIETLSW